MESFFASVRDYIAEASDYLRRLGVREETREESDAVRPSVVRPWWVEREQIVLEQARSAGRSATSSGIPRNHTSDGQHPMDRSGAPSSGKRRASRISNETARERLLSIATLNAAMQGDRLIPASEKFESHSLEQCKHPLAGMQGQVPCWRDLWHDRDELYRRREHLLNLSQEARSELVFSRLQNACYADEDASGARAEEKSWHYWIGGREVCRHTFLLDACISEATLYKLLARIERDCTTAHDKSELDLDTVEDESMQSLRALGVVGWYQGYADRNGDWMPDEQLLVVPRCERKDEHAEYAAALGKGAVSLSYFCQILHEHPMLDYIVRARQLYNFQDCKVCADANEKIRRALAAGKKQEADEARAERKEHLVEARGEKVSYYKRREHGRDPNEDSVSIILDAMDSLKTTTPWFARSPGHFWSALRKSVLQQHLLGVLVHGRPNSAYLYAFNESIKADANSNIEGIRRTLASEYPPDGDRPMPKTVFVQADSASNNKCWAVILFLAMLVFHGYTKDIYLSFLLVGHTHEDIDQLFSIISRYFRKLFRILTPNSFRTEVCNALAKQPCHFEQMSTVLDWSSHLRPHLVHPMPKGLARATLPWDGTEEHVVSSGGGSDGGSSGAGSHGSRSEVRVPRTFWIHRRADGVVVMHYKELSTDLVWLPSLPQSAPDAPLVTDPDGIVLFGSAPPDPMSNPPKEVELC